MLSDPLNITTSGNHAEPVTMTWELIPFVRIEPAIEVDGRTVRTGTISSLPATVTISRTTSKENKPYGTDRITVRAELRKLDGLGNPVVPFVSVTFGLPKAIATPSELNALRVALLTHLLFGEEGTEGYSIAGGAVLLNRLLAGEG